jgi:glycogen(starch) synthase
MKVLMTTDTVGGVWTYALELARVLGPAGVDVVLATMGPEMSVAQAREAAALANVTVCESTWKLEWMSNPWADVVAAGEWLLRLEETHRPDVIHLNGYVHGALPWRAPVVVVAHSCVLSWWQAVKRGPAPMPEWGRYAAAVRRGIAQADMVVTVSREMLREVGRYYGPLPASRVIYNAREPALFAPRRKRPLIFSAGRLWDEAKNVAALVRVAGEVDWPVCVAGEAGEVEARSEKREARRDAKDKADRTVCPTEEIREETDKNVCPTKSGEETDKNVCPTKCKDKADKNVCHPVRRLGKLDQKAMAGWLGASSVYCLPARYEPFGLSALEAALAGCSLVLGDIASLREVWGNAAVFVPPDDSAALRRALQRLIADPALRAEMARRARERAALYSPQRMLGAYVSVYGHLAGAGASSETREVGAISSAEAVYPAAQGAAS